MFLILHHPSNESISFQLATPITFASSLITTPRVALTTISGHSKPKDKSLKGERFGRGILITCGK
jgi:hypothetical protein